MKKMVKRAGPILLLGLLGCDARPSLYRADPPADKDFPRTVSVSEARLTLGFATGVLREEVQVEGFRISRHPTTVGQYRACVKAGACSEPGENECRVRGPSLLERPNYRARGRHRDNPVTCVGFEQARAYCQWLGADLPTLEQWTLAARGPSITRHAWGKKPAGCEEHPLADRPQSGPPSSHPNESRIRRCADDGEHKKLRIGKHPKGASPSGMQDVLLTRGELVHKTKGSLYAACDAPNPGCVVVGMQPGAMDSAVPAQATRSEYRAQSQEEESVVTGDALASTVDPYSFRCAWRNQ